uniref:Uncharacterized protein n=1 Tax=Cannabis sativa TaxID=3483 RepID=A0A803P5G3_CANSA
MDHLFPARMSLLSSEVHLSKPVLARRTNPFPFLPKDFSPQPKPKMMDSKTKEFPTNPNHGDPIAFHG